MGVGGVQLQPHDHELPELRRMGKARHADHRPHHVDPEPAAPARSMDAHATLEPVGALRRLLEQIGQRAGGGCPYVLSQATRAVDSGEGLVVGGW